MFDIFYFSELIVGDEEQEKKKEQRIRITRTTRITRVFRVKILRKREE